MKKVIILGGGESGVGAAILAKKRKYDVFVSDFGKISEKYKQTLDKNKIPFEEEGHKFDIRKIEFVIKSPGVPTTAPIVKLLKSNGVKIISEIEFGYLHYHGKVYAVTGSNGKTTTSGLFFHILREAGYDVAIGGNYGYSFARIVAEQSPEHVVLELSSFQLDDIETFSPNIAILLNISADHLDRYNYDIEKYALAKYRITERQSEKDHFIYNGMDDLTLKMLGIEPTVARKHVILQTDFINGISSMEDNHIFEISIKGRHNLFNARCVVEAARILGVSENDIARGLKTFVNEPHRIEEVATIDGVLYINDSKATNVDAVYYALDAMEKPIIWIVGGVDKGNDYSQIADLVRSKVKRMVCVGKDNKGFTDFFDHYGFSIDQYESMEEGVKQAYRVADEGDVVLLSPACASFDLFNNYMHRGELFKEAVRKLKV